MPQSIIAALWNQWDVFKNRTYGNWAHLNKAENEDIADLEESLRSYLKRFDFPETKALAVKALKFFVQHQKNNLERLERWLPVFEKALKDLEHNAL